MDGVFYWTGVVVCGVTAACLAVITLNICLNIYWGWVGARRAFHHIGHLPGYRKKCISLALKNWHGSRNSWWEHSGKRWPVDGRKPVTEWYGA